MKLKVTPKFISSNGKMAFAKLQRTQSLAHPTICAAFLLQIYKIQFAVISFCKEMIRHFSRKHRVNLSKDFSKCAVYTTLAKFTSEREREREWANCVFNILG